MGSEMCIRDRISAPLSTRKGLLRLEQKTERAPWVCGREEEREEMVKGPGVTDDPRLWRFPGPEQQKGGAQLDGEEESALA